MEQLETTQHLGKEEIVKGIKITLIISLSFFVATLPVTNLSKLSSVLCNLYICLAYGFSIYSGIYLSYWAVIKYLSSKNRQISFKFSVLASFTGVIIGVMLGEFFRSLIIGNEFYWNRIPFHILIGGFISLMFIYYESHQEKEQENKILSDLNEKLEKRNNKKWLDAVTSNIGGTTKVVPTSEVHYFMSIDSYTHAITTEGEFIVDFSITKLSESLNPNEFVKIHRNSIVRLSEVEKIQNGGNWTVVTKSGQELSVSRNSRTKLRNSLNN